MTNPSSTGQCHLRIEDARPGVVVAGFQAWSTHRASKKTKLENSRNGRSDVTVFFAFAR